MIYRASVLLSLLLLCAVPLFAQAQVLQGEVVNASTKEPLAFVSVGVLNGRYGTTTDIDGKFSIRLPEGDCQLVFSYVGYIRKVYSCQELKGNRFLQVNLQENTVALNEVLITPKENPAHRIIRLAVKNREKNDPFSLPSFRYNSYNKVHFTLKEAAAASLADTASVLPANTSDTTKAAAFLSKSHIFFSETYTERIYLAPNYSKETVIANKMSGYSNPVIAMVATDFQPISFYGEHILFFENQYLNPISKGSTGKYSFTLEQTLLHEGDTTFIVAFEPREGKNFNGLKGVLSINSNGYALQNVIAEPADRHLMIKFRIQQKYERIEGQWFPVQLNTDAELVQYKLQGRNMAFSSRSYLENIEVAAPLSKRSFSHIETELHPRANKRSPDDWQTYRTDSLDIKEQRTYQVYDSMSADKKLFLNTYMNLIEGLMLNRFKIGKVDLLADKLYQYNEYEGARLGIGLETNEALFSPLRLGGYLAYGFRDKALKFGANLNFLLHARTESWLKLSYKQDVAEPGEVDFFRKSRLPLGQEAFRDFMTSRMDSLQQLKAALSFRAFKFLQLKASLTAEQRNPTYRYVYAPTPEVGRAGSASFSTAEAGIGLRYAHGERYTQIGRGAVVLKPAYPTFTAYLGQGLRQEVLQGDYSYTRFALKAEHVFYTRGLGRTGIQLTTGAVRGQAPYAYLSTGQGSYTTDFTGYLFVQNYFQTMGLYEFLSDRYAYLFLTHNFGKLLYKSGNQFIQPELIVAQHIGVGTLQNPADHQGVTFSTMEEGYFESGLLIDNLLRLPYANLAYLGFGGGAFYRYGPYALPQTKDNIAYKLSVKFSF